MQWILLSPSILNKAFDLPLKKHFSVKYYYFCISIINRYKEMVLKKVIYDLPAVIIDLIDTKGVSVKNL
jgi:hypothetical protein